MTRPRRRPFDPLLAQYQREQADAEAARKRDRKASKRDLNRGISSHVAPVEVDNPNATEPGDKIAVMRNLRDDPLARLHSRGIIDEAQQAGGRAYQADWETAERGPRAIDPSKEAVDGGRPPEPLTDGQRKAVVRLHRVQRDLGADGSAITHDVLIGRLTFAQVCDRRGYEGWRWEDYFSRRFRECLDRLAIAYGFSNENPTPQLCE